MGLLQRCINCAKPREHCLAQRRQHREVSGRGMGYPRGTNGRKDEALPALFLG